jgi:hypothetical protein
LDAPMYVGVLINSIPFGLLWSGSQVGQQSIV